MMTLKPLILSMEHLRKIGGYLPAGLMAQDVQAKCPGAVFAGANGYMVIDLPVLARKDKLISDMFMEGEYKSCQQFFNE